MEKTLVAYFIKALKSLSDLRALFRDSAKPIPYNDSIELDFETLSQITLHALQPDQQTGDPKTDAYNGWMAIAGIMEKTPYDMIDEERTKCFAELLKDVATAIQGSTERLTIRQDSLQIFVRQQHIFRELAKLHTEKGSTGIAEPVFDQGNVESIFNHKGSSFQKTTGRVNARSLTEFIDKLFLVTQNFPERPLLTPVPDRRERFSSSKFFSPRNF